MTAPHTFPKFGPFLDLAPLRQYKTVAIQCKNSPQPDDVAASFGLYQFFKTSAKKVSLTCDGPSGTYSPNVLEMVGQLGIPMLQEADSIARPDLLVLVNQDGSDEACLDAKNICVVGNHKPLARLPELSDVRPHLSAASTLIWKLLEQAGHKPDETLATALYYGLYDASAAFREIRFPLDLDLKEALAPPVANRWIFDKLTRSNLSLDDLKSAAKALDGLQYHSEGRFVVINVLPGDDSVVGFLGDMAMRVGGVDAAVVFSESAAEVRFKLRAVSRELNVQDLASWLIDGQLGASYHGNREQVGGFFQPGPEFDKADSALEFFLRRLKAYYEAHEIIDCAKISKPDNRNMRAYQKKPVQQAYLSSVELAAPGTPLSIRMLEGDIDIIAAEDIYLLIGLSGEVYPIRSETFRRAYKPVEGQFSEDFIYPPVVTNLVSGEKIKIDDLAKCCINQETRVLARQLKTRVKLFSKWVDHGYLYGRVGDWLVQRRENPSDMYIVTGELFPLMYTRVNR